jgi:DNA-binding MltR family transcriptional regulator
MRRKKLESEERAKFFYQILRESMDLKQLDDLPVKETFSFNCSLSEETDRGCALMAAAYLDFELQRLLEATFLENKKISKVLFDYNGPLSNFSSKIDIAYMMGLISDLARRDLHILRKIRNDFAHRHEKFDFEQTKISDRCNELQHLNTLFETDSRGKFTNSMMGIAAEIHVAIYTAKRIKPKKGSDPSEAVKMSREIRLKLFENLSKLNKRGKT